MTSPVPSPVRPERRAVVATLLVLLLAPCAWGQAPEGCADVFRNAEHAYLDSRYEETIRLLTPCLNAGDLERAQIIEMHRLLSMAHMNSGDADGARRAILNLLRTVPDYEPDPVQDPPSYTVLVRVIQDQLRQPGGAEGGQATPRTSWTKKPGNWIAIAGGLLVVGITAVLTGDGGAAN